MSEVDPDVSQLGYWRSRREKRTWTGAVTIIVALFGLLSLNTYLMFLSTDAVIMNIDQARLEQSDQVDRLEFELAHLENQIATLQQSLKEPPPGAASELID